MQANTQPMIVGWIAHNAANQAEKTATIELPSGRRQTYAQMNDRVGRIAAWLVDLGVGRGDRVGRIGNSSSVFATTGKYVSDN